MISDADALLLLRVRTTVPSAFVILSERFVMYAAVISGMPRFTVTSVPVRTLLLYTCFADAVAIDTFSRLSVPRVRYSPADISNWLSVLIEYAPFAVSTFTVIPSRVTGASTNQKVLPDSYDPFIEMLLLPSSAMLQTGASPL